jgi:hypothetical protein
LSAVSADQTRFEHVVWGFVEGFDAFTHATNSVTRPSDVGPH